jgi:hypothetical protein
MTHKILILLLFVLTLCPDTGSSAGTVRRFVLAAGVNSGGPERIPLMYAVSDAERFTDVMTKMGGVDPADHILLREPDLEGFENRLGDLRDWVSAAKDSAGRTEVLLFYSGHADEDGLLLGDERLSYSALRKMMDEIEADVRITVLDACASGAITRMKGGQRRQAFLVDDSSEMQGYAFLTSSSADETAQESDRIGASFFTHYLISGMRGAADVSGEGKVTLNEAYQFAFHETLARTTETQGGAQHPAYHINLSGTGDVVMTDLRQTSAGLLLTEELGGRLFVRNDDQQLVAELYKPAGRSVELGLEPGSYEIVLEDLEDLLIGKVILESGDRLVLGYEHFEPGERERTVSRGRQRGLPQTLRGRHRIDLHLGYWGTQPDNFVDGSGLINTTVGTWDVLGGLGYSRWLREDLSLGVNIMGLGGEASTSIGTGVSTQSFSLASILIHAKKYLPESTLRSNIRPFLTMGAGVFIGTIAETSIGPTIDVNVGETMGAFGGQIGGGVDLPMGRFFIMGSKVAYNIVSDFDKPVGDRDNFSGFEFTMSLGLMLGKGY